MHKIYELGICKMKIKGLAISIKFKLFDICNRKHLNKTIYDIFLNKYIFKINILMNIN